MPKVMASVSQSIGRHIGGTLIGAAGTADLAVSFGFEAEPLALVGLTFSMSGLIAKIRCRRKTDTRLESTAVCPIKSDGGNVVLRGLRSVHRIRRQSLIAQNHCHHWLLAESVAAVVEGHQRQQRARHRRRKTAPQPCRRRRYRLGGENFLLKPRRRPRSAEHKPELQSPPTSL